jgi:GNAT superfamily N-acetyltransferase
MTFQHPPAAVAQAQPRLLPANLADFAAVATLFAELHQYNASLDAHFTLAENWRQLLEEHFQRTCSLPSALWLLAWVDERPAGLLILENHLDSPLFRHHDWVELVALYVRASYRGAGLARHLMDEARLWATTRGTERMQLYVTTTNEQARAFYRHCGWKPVQEIWRLALSGPGPVSALDDPSCGTEAERQATMLERGHTLAGETRRSREEEHAAHIMGEHQR